jgi:hypothetical protein
VNYHALLAHYPKITYTRYKKLVGYFSDISEIWDAELTDLIKAGLDDTIAQAKRNSHKEKHPILSLRCSRVYSRYSAT